MANACVPGSAVWILISPCWWWEPVLRCSCLWIHSDLWFWMRSTTAPTNRTLRCPVTTPVISPWTGFSAQGQRWSGQCHTQLDSWLQWAPDGPLTLACLRRRISEQCLPPVHVVDMRNELAEGHRRLISRPLMERLQQLPEQGEQAVVLVPRRGYSPFLGCRSCGEVVQCPHCDVALTVHRPAERQWLRCHWCDHRAEIERRCGHCGSTAFKPFGAGTQRVLELLAEELQDLRLLRFDRDSTGGRDGHRQLLDRFAAGRSRCADRHPDAGQGDGSARVTLAAVLAADGLLHRPDLRAGEQALQLLLQLAGRAGRGERPGQVLVQTYSPEHPVIQHLVDGRYEAFLAQEESSCGASKRDWSPSAVPACCDSPVLRQRPRQRRRRCWLNDLRTCDSCKRLAG